MTSSARLQHEADTARAGLSSALDDLRSSVTTTALTNGAMTFAKDGSTAVARAAVDRAMANPLAALLIGAGVVMLLSVNKETGGSSLVEHGKSALKSAVNAVGSLGASAAGAVGSLGSSAASAATGTVSGLADRATKAAGDATDQAKDLLHKGQDQASDLLQKGQDQASDLLHKGQAQGQQALDDAQKLLQEGRNRFEQFAQEQPILVAALGVAFGAALGAALPITKAEQDYLGDTTRKAKSMGTDIVHQVADTVTGQFAGQNVAHKVGEVVSAVSSTVTQGLSKS